MRIPFRCMVACVVLAGCGRTSSGADAASSDGGAGGSAAGAAGVGGAAGSSSTGGAAGSSSAGAGAAGSSSTGGAGAAGSAGSGGAQTSGTYPDVATFCEAVGVAECSVNVTAACNEAHAPCVSAVTSHCLQGSLDFAPSADALSRYQPSWGDACIEALTAAYLVQPIPAATYVSARNKCLAAFSKDVALGGPCVVDSDCDPKDGTNCWFHTDPISGVCAQLVDVAAGMSCAASGSVCAGGYFCKGSFDACVQVTSVSGDPCSAINPCEIDLICDQIDATGTGNCSSPRQQGESCTEDAQCIYPAPACVGLATAKQCDAEIAFSFGAPTCEALAGK